MPRPITLRKNRDAARRSGPGARVLLGFLLTILTILILSGLRYY